jgi:hypothetical protein
MESRSSITNTFHNVVENRNPYQYTNRRRRPEPTPASLFVSAVQYIISTKDGEGGMLVSAHASTVYAV